MFYCGAITRSSVGFGLVYERVDTFLVLLLQIRINPIHQNLPVNPEGEVDEGRGQKM